MADIIIIFSGLMGALIAGGVANGYLKPKAFSTQELAVMAISLFGFIAGVIIGDQIIQLF